MRRIIIERLVHSIIVILGVLVVVFVLVRLTGDPAALLLGPDATAKDIAAFRHDLGLDEPMYVQLLSYLGQVVQGNFGNSLRYRQPALQLVLQRIPATAELAFAAMLLCVTFSLPLGMLAAYNRNRLLDHLTTVGALVGQSMPGFWVGLMLILIFPVRSGLLYTSGRGGIEHLILPAVTLSLFSLARLTRVVRSTALDVLRLDYLRTARAKGLSELLVLYRHAARNILIPVVTIVGLEVATLFGGAVVTETVFAWPGMGQLAITAVAARDFPLIQASVIVVGAIVVLVNYLVDLSYAVIDPRIRSQGRGM